MAVATPVLERQTIQPQADISSDALHNAQIKENYRRLMDPNFGTDNSKGSTAAMSKEQALEDLRASILRHSKPAQPEIAQAPVRQAEYVQPVTVRPVVEQPVVQQPVMQQPAMVQAEQPAQPYLVTNARADAEIFRADSPVNQRFVNPAQAPVVIDEEENEDLRPTMTTIQYKNMTESEKREVRAIAAEQRNKRVLSGRDKAIIATFISVVVALFVLVIVNSAVIAGLNSELSIIENNINTVSWALDNVNAQIDSITSLENIALYAQANGLVMP